MRYMMLLRPGQEAKESDWMPSADIVAEMSRYNEELEKAGVRLSAEGLHEPSQAIRVTFNDGATTVTDGPFTEVREVIGGYWILEVGSREEAIEWARRAPLGGGATIELRQIWDFEDFPEELQAAANPAATRP